jgi:hypothetical protein
LTTSDLANLYFATRPKDPEFYSTVFSQLEKQDASEATTLKLINAIQQGKLLRELSLDSYDCAEGRKSIIEVQNKIQSLSALLEADKQEDGDGEFEFVTDDLAVLVNDSIRTHGLRWRLNTLNHMLGSLRRGDFGFLFARPETGKTTFLASEVTFMASQATAPVLWINNEEQGNKVMLRCYQAALGVDMTTLFRDLEGNKKKYHELTKGQLRIFDGASIHKRTVERLCQRIKPALIIFDQIDKIVGFDNDREDLRLGTIYQWARELAKTYCPVIGVCQADGSDWILGIGKINESGYDQLRYLHLSKNKLIGDSDSVPELRHGRREVLIEPEIARYSDIG